MPIIKYSKKLAFLRLLQYYLLKYDNIFTL